MIPKYRIIMKQDHIKLNYYLQEDLGDGYGNPGYVTIGIFPELLDAETMQQTLELKDGIVVK